MKPIVIIESPYAGRLEFNRNYLRDALRDSILRGEAPFTSHAIYPLALNDTIPGERKLGLELGYEFWRAADLIAFYIDHGMSKGMRAAEQEAIKRGMVVEYRKLSIPSV